MNSDTPNNTSGESTSEPAPAEEFTGFPGALGAENPYAHRPTKVTQATRLGAQLRPSDEPWSDIPAAEDESSSPGDDTSGTQDGAAGNRQPRTRDPAILCAHVMIRHRLRRLTPEQRRSQIFAIEVAPSWVGALRRVWPSEARKAWASFGLDVPWLLREPEHPAGDRAKPPKPSTAEFTGALIDGEAVVGISADPTHELPRELTSAPDCVHLAVPPPDRVALRVVARAITGSSPPATIDVPVPDRVTPEALRLACRRGQSPQAAGWCRRPHGGTRRTGG